MTDSVKALLDILKAKAYRQSRVDVPLADHDMMSAVGVCDFSVEALGAERPVLFPGDIIGFNRYNGNKLPGICGNWIPDYATVLKEGLCGVRARLLKALAGDIDAEQKEYGECVLRELDAMQAVADRYREAAKAASPCLAKALERVPAHGATTFHEACVAVKFYIYTMRLSGVSHVTLGRFDQYMLPYYNADRARGVSDEEQLETLEHFFISINFDSDIYPGIQQGDNGQSMVLGGYDLDGNDLYNPVSELCMNASLELSLIDPKINLRVSKKTPLERYRFATLLTKKGLGFPQYCNDDVVVPGLTALGYKPEHAVDYGVAACWEYIMSGVASDIPNIDTFDFPHLVNRVITEKLPSVNSFEGLKQAVKVAIREQCDNMVRFAAERVRQGFSPCPIAAIFVQDCIGRLRDPYRGGALYFNLGCHGAGIATATDSLAAVKKLIFDEKSVSKEQLLSALADNFKGHEPLRNRLLACPKMGNNDDEADGISLWLMETYADCINGRDNEVGGIWRAGTGSAQEYVFRGQSCPATADGRYAGTPYASSFTPSPDAQVKGLLSVILSFTKFDLKRVINGGPLTVEIHDTVLKNDIGIEKTAMLVKKFIDRGGHQLQINSINRDTLLDAQKHPENYPNLIVRVWGWSGYFNELDAAFQNHIIRRTEYTC